VIGVALLLAITVISLSGLTATVGIVVQDNAATADAARVQTALDEALDPVEATGRHRGEVAFTTGRLATVDRDVRILNQSGVVRTVATGGLIYETEHRRIEYVADALLRGRGNNSRPIDPPSITASTAGDGVLVVGVPRLGAPDVSVSGNRQTSVTLTTTVSHRRYALGRGQYAVAIETTAPAGVADALQAKGARTHRRDFDGDGVPSVVASFPGTRTGYLVIHDLDLEVT
jgi:hypothetical protein